MTSYSAWLFISLKANYSACSISKHAPHEVLLDDPSTYSVHVAGASGCGGSYAEKSVKHWDLITPLGSYRMSNSESSTDHPIIRMRTFRD